MQTALETRADLRQYQILHDGHALHVLVVVARGASGAECSAAVADRLRESLSKLPVQPPPIEVRVVHSIPREGGHGAKLRLIRSVPLTSSTRLHHGVLSGR